MTTDILTLLRIAQDCGTVDTDILQVAGDELEDLRKALATAQRDAQIDRNLALVRQTALAQAVEERDEANAALRRVWSALNIDTYVGKEISECVADLRDQARAAYKTGWADGYKVGQSGG